MGWFSIGPELCKNSHRPKGWKKKPPASYWQCDDCAKVFITGNYKGYPTFWEYKEVEVEPQLPQNYLPTESIVRKIY